MTAWKRQLDPLIAAARRLTARLTGPVGRFLLRPLILAGRQCNPLRADAFIWGRDNPRFWHGTTYGLLLNALLVLMFTVPLSIRGCGMMAAYGLPKGSGQAVLAQRITVKKIKKKKRKPISYKSDVVKYAIRIDESEILDKLRVETLNTYAATGGKLGKGGGTKGGWPSGMENARVRFIRLEYDGGDWDQDMGVDADYNLLLQFRDMTGFQIAPSTEHMPISALRRFPKHRAPPFVFITGKGNISVSAADIKALRWYCMDEGGMLFADNGGGTFNIALRSLTKQAFPELQWVDIANDDLIYQQPYFFPNGAPPLFHHSGSRALGLKHNGRWIVFYHQGDVNDAWKTGHSGVSKSLATEAYRLGVNIMYYAFNQYSDLHPAP